MYAGHIGAGLGAYSFRKAIPLWLILVAAQFPDWLDAGMCIANMDRGPYGLYTHGFIAVGIAAAAFGLIAYAITRDFTAALVVVLVVASHWALDYLTGLKPTWPGGPVVGLELYSRPVVDVIMESATILAGWLVYRRTLARDMRNHGWTYAMLFTLCALQVLAGAAFALSLGGHTKC